jgi:hypothetical protein
MTKPRPKTVDEKLPCDRPGELFQRVIELLKADDAPPLSELREHFGFSSDYLHQLRSGKIKNPSVNRIEALYKKLTGNPIRL